MPYLHFILHFIDGLSSFHLALYFQEPHWQKGFLKFRLCKKSRDILVGGRGASQVLLVGAEGVEDIMTFPEKKGK